MKITAFLILFMLFGVFVVESQTVSNDDFGIGLRFQKTEQLYWENGIGFDYSSDFLFKKHLHLKMSYATSGLGSAISGNALLQDNILVGADWRFRAEKDLQFFVGANTGFFHVDMPTPAFDALPKSAMLCSIETGLFYKFHFPMATSLSVGYNLLSGDGVSRPGTLFPVFYQLSVFYYLHKDVHNELHVL